MHFVVTGGAGQDGLLALDFLKSHRPHYRVTPIVKSEGQAKLVWDYAGLNSVVAPLVTKELWTSILLPGAENVVLNFAGKSSVADSWTNPGSVFSQTSESLANLLVVLMENRELSQKTHLIQPSTVEIFSGTQNDLQNPTVFNVDSPYGVSKQAEFQICMLYKKVAELRISMLVLGNHESPLRPRKFLSKHLVSSLLEVSQAKRQEISLSRPEIRRRWAYAPEVIINVIRHAEEQVSRNILIQGSSELSVLEFARLGASILGIGSEVFRIASEPDRPSDRLSSRPEFSCDASDVIYCRVSVEQILREMLQAATAGDDDHNWKCSWGEL